MSSILDQIRAQAELAAQTGPDMNEAVVGGSARVLPLGTAMARLVGYVELGMQPQEYNGAAKAPAMEFQLCFALTGAAPNPDPAGAPIPYTNDDGSPYLYWTYPTSMSRNDKATAFLVFKAMNYKGTAKTFGQLVGEGFLLPIVAHTNAKSKKVTHRPDLRQIKPPYYPDPMTGTVVQAAVPPHRDQDLKFFSWDHPTLESFNSLKVEGEWENKDEATGVIKKESKNKMQEALLGATNFSGSALETLLKMNNVAYTVPAKQAAAVAPAVPGAVAPAVPGVVAPAVPGVIAPAAPVVAPVAAAPNVIAPPVALSTVAPVVAAATPAPVQTTAPASPAPAAVVTPSAVVPIQVAAPAEPSPVGVVATPVVNLPPALAA